MKPFVLIAIAAVLAPCAAVAQTAAEREACKADYEKYCKQVRPGGGRIIECLSQHLDELTPQCKSVVVANLPK